MKTIDYRFKILYAIGMVMVVCGHCQGGGISFTISDWFPYGGLHLALFVFCSGYFYKKEAEKQTGRYFVKKIKTLIIPLYVYTVVYGILVELSRLKDFSIGEDISWYNIFIAPITTGHQFAYNLGGWFIIPLFMVEIVNVLIRKLGKRAAIKIPEWGYFIVAIVVGCIGNQLACSGLYTGWWLVLVRFTYFIPFYYLGILYKNVLERYEKKIPNFWYFVVIVGIKLVIIYRYGKSVAYTPSWCNNFTEGPVMPIVVGILGIAFWVRMANLLEPIIGKSKIVNLIANNTYSIMMNQFLGFMAVKTMFALISKYTSHFQDFNWFSYKSDLWWYYTPRGVVQVNILYMIAGIVLPVMIQYGIYCVKSILMKKKRITFSGYIKE